MSGTSALLASHVIAGTAALVCGPLAMLTQKGGGNHRRVGTLYFWAMAWVALSAVMLAWVRPQPFLALIGLFSFYLAFTGLRAVRRKPPRHPAAAIDWAATLVMLVAAAALAFLAARFSSGFAPVAWTFAGIGGLLASTDIVRFVRPDKDPMAWWFLHMIRMLSAYIATVTAFAVVNLSFLPAMIPWFGPTVLGTIGITLWVRYYRIRFRSHAEACADYPGGESEAVGGLSQK